MHPADIIATLHKAGHPPCKVAQALAVSRAAVSQVIHGETTSYNIASYIAAVSNTPLKRLWTDGRYDRPQLDQPAARAVA